MVTSSPELHSPRSPSARLSWLALGRTPVASARRHLAATPMLRRVEGTWTDPGVTIDSATPTPWESLYIVKLHGNTTVAGAFAGVSDYSFTLLADVATGASRGNGVETFTATLAGRGSGTLTILEHLEVAADSSTTVAGLGGDRRQWCLGRRARPDVVPGRQPARITGWEWHVPARARLRSLSVVRGPSTSSVGTLAGMFDLKITGRNDRRRHGRRPVLGRRRGRTATITAVGGRLDGERRSSTPTARSSRPAGSTSTRTTTAR